MLTTLFTNLREQAIACHNLEFAEEIIPAEMITQLDHAERRYARDENGRFAPTNSNTADLKKRLLAKYKNPQKSTEDFIKDNPNGTQTRKYATNLAKRANELAKSKDAPFEDMEDTLSELDTLRDYASKKRNYYLYEIDEEVGDDETPESWRYEKAEDALTRAYSNLDEKYQERDEARYKRIKRKRFEKGLD